MKVLCPHADCGRKYTSDFNLQRHIKAAHLNERPFQCPECLLTFGYQHVLLHHRLKKHPAPPSDPLPSHVQPLSRPLLIPKLTQLLENHPDPVLGCYVHINRIYMFPVVDCEIQLSQITEEPREIRPLPTLAQTLGRERRIRKARIME